MKKAKRVDVPTDRPLDFDEYESLKKHAYNSALWYINNYGKNSYQIRTKLYDKGFLKTEIKVIHDEKEFYSNIVEEVIEQLIDYSFINDEQYIDNAISSGLNKGKSLSAVKTKLFQTGLPKDLIDEGIERFEEKEDDNLEDEALDKAANKIVRSYAFTKIDDPFKAKQKIIQSLGTKGFQIGKILEWIDENLDLEVDWF